MNKLAVALVLLFLVVAGDMVLVALGVLGGPELPISPVPELSPTPLLQAREGFRTQGTKSSYRSRGDAPIAPRSEWETLRYYSPAGELVAYLSPDPSSPTRWPAVLWAHRGFGGIGAEIWAPDHPLQTFRKKGMVVFVPSWRGENDNPGSFELFLGEVQDAVAAVNYLANLDYVDPARIYMVGVAEAGTLSMLTALATDKLRAAFAIGGTPDLARIMEGGRGYGNNPYVHQLPRETFLRSPIHFARHLSTPTFFFGGADEATAPDARRMEALSQQAPARFTACLVEGARSEQLEGPMLEFVSRKILLDKGATSLEIDPQDAQVEFDLQKR